MTYCHEVRYWCPTHGGNVLRMAMLGSDGYERHCVLDMDVSGSDRRRHRMLALEQLDRLRESERPGEVKIDLEAEFERG